MTASESNLKVKSYSMQNGYSAVYEYWDDSYTGKGDKFKNSSFLSEGTGDLTDGVTASENWFEVERFPGAGPYVGWYEIDPEIDFFFGEDVRIDSLIIYSDDSNGSGDVSIPSEITVQVGNKTFTSEKLIDPDGAVPTKFSFSNLDLRGSSAKVTVKRKDKWIFLSEIQFQGQKLSDILPPPSAKILASKLTYNEGDILVFTVSTENLKSGSVLYCSISGDGITQSDLAVGNLLSSGIVDKDRRISFSYLLSNDLESEGPEELKISIFSDQSKTKELSTSTITVIDTSSAISEEKSFRTFNSKVQDYKLGTDSSDRLIISDHLLSKTWALWGVDANDSLIAGNKDDILIGGNGIDTLTGGKGKDLFIIGDLQQTDYDIIRDFNPKEDILGFTIDAINVRANAKTAIVRYKDISTSLSAEKTFKSKKADFYILIDSADNIKKVNSKSFSKQINFAVDTTKQSIFHDSDGIWNKGNDVLCKFTGKFSPNSWTDANFTFGIDLS